MQSSPSPRSWRRLGLSAAALALAATACSSSDSVDSTPTEPAPAIADAAVVPEALQFTAPLVGGGEFSGADVADKPTLFWFWAPT